MYNIIKDRSSQEEKKITLLFLFWPLLGEENESEGSEAINDQPDTEVRPRITDRTDLTVSLRDTPQNITDLVNEMRMVNEIVDESSRSREELSKRLDELDSRVDVISNNTIVLPDSPTEDDIKTLLTLADLARERIRRQNNLNVLLSKEKTYVESFVFAEKLVMTMADINLSINNYVEETNQKEVNTVEVNSVEEHAHEEHAVEEHAVEEISKSDDEKLSGDENTVKGEDQLECGDQLDNKDLDAESESAQWNEWTPELQYLSDSCGL